MVKKQIDKSKTNFIKEWLIKSTLFNNAELRTDYLNPNSNEKKYFSLEQEETTEPLKVANVLGTILKGSLNFVLAARFDFDLDRDDYNNNNLAEMQKIVDWILEQKIADNYPQLDENEICTDVQVTSSPYLYGYNKDMTQARYQIKFKINYERRVINNGRTN